METNWKGRRMWKDVRYWDGVLGQPGKIMRDRRTVVWVN